MSFQEKRKVPRDKNLRRILDASFDAISPQLTIALTTPLVQNVRKPLFEPSLSTREIVSASFAGAIVQTGNVADAAGSNSWYWHTGSRAERVFGVARGDFLTRGRGQLALPLMPTISCSPEIYAAVRIWLRYYEIYGIIILDIRCL